MFANICWWNAFVQLFTSTRNQLIVDKMKKFIDNHKKINHYDVNNNNNKQCWYCNVFQAIIDIMVENNNTYVIDFSKILFDIPNEIVDPKNKNKTKHHQFHIFILNRQNDAIEGCDQFFDVIDECAV